jgi:hypothetical protein
MKKQSPNKAPQETRRAPKQRKASYPRVVEFQEARGRTVEKVVLSTDSDFPCGKPEIRKCLSAGRSSAAMAHEGRIILQLCQITGAPGARGFRVTGNPNS